MEWQPIETAPIEEDEHDRTPRLRLRLGDGTETVGYYVYGDSIGAEVWWPSHWRSEDDREVKPTHWMPLPEPSTT